MELKISLEIKIHPSHPEQFQYFAKTTNADTELVHFTSILVSCFYSVMMNCFSLRSKGQGPASPGLYVGTGGTEWQKGEDTFFCLVDCYWYMAMQRERVVWCKVSSAFEPFPPKEEVFTIFNLGYCFKREILTCLGLFGLSSNKCSML